MRVNEYSIDNNTTESQPSGNLVLKVLFGPMFGCELQLPEEDYFLIIDQGNSQDISDLPVQGEHAAAFTENTLYLPCGLASPNLMLRLSSPAQGEDNKWGYPIEICGSNGIFHRVIGINEIFSHEHISLAIKRSKDDWSDTIKNYNQTISANPTHSIQGENSFTYQKKSAFLLLAIALIFLIVGTSFLWYKKKDNENLLYTIEQELAGSPFSLSILHGRSDNIIYVLASKYQAKEWAQKTIFKMKKNHSIIPIWLSQFGKEAVSQLTAAGYPVIQMDYTNPQKPVVVLFRDLAPHEEESLKGCVFQITPFAQEIKTRVRTKSQLLKEARQGLERQNIYYRQINTPDGYALVVRDALSDNAFRALHHFIKEFTRQWGDRVINFSINLDENWLQDKSYLDSENGYLFLNPRHWYFPLNKGYLNEQ
ncbi:PrgH/EprH family type III secretion apparatus protein [Enterobacter cloacae]|uniref:PrgH/EprH family type III secretion apparatus protein n=1 Tax=Enterobacter cloacae TaxID=550 RepID=UPI002FF59419